MQWLIAYALRFVGIPYFYGGLNPLQGFDCSGLVQELLVAGGALPFQPPGAKMNAQQLHDLFVKQGSVGTYGPGALAFYGPDITRIDHVAFCLDSFLAIEAAGGKADCVTPEIAKAENAFVKLRPIRYRGDFLCVIKPNYSKIGMSP